LGTKIFFANNYFDVNKYETPIQTFISNTGSNFNTESYVQTNLLITPVTITTHDGLVFENEYSKTSYKYEDAVRTTVTRTVTDPTLDSYSFYLMNYVQTNDRFYKRFQDVLARIGGFVKALVLMCQVLNYMVNEFEEVCNTLDFLNKNKVNLVSNQE
jgi:hypothetical protein